MQNGMWTFGKWRWAGVALLLVAMGIATSCAKQQTDRPTVGRLQPSEFALLLQDPLANPAALATLSGALQNTPVSAMDEAQLWALSQCDCTPRRSGAYLQQLTLGRGVLPQVLVPSVREQIANDPKLKALSNLPGPLQGIGDALSQFFTKDERLATMIRDGVAEKLSKALGGQDLAKQHSFRFDAFIGPFGAFGQGAAVGHPAAFDAKDQAVKWAFIFGAGNIWEGRDPLALNNHSLQLLSVAMALSEWQYLLGMERASSDQRTYGGLTIDPRVGNASPLAGYDPRANPTATPRIISGTYSISYPTDGRALDMAINVREQWSRAPADVSLDEQAKMWTAAGRAFQRLRPANRQRIAQAFTEPQGMFPAETHQLPLVFLSGMGEMLNGPFLDKDALAIYVAARIPGASIAAQNGADLASVVRLARALNLWVKQTQDLSDAQLSPEVAQKLSEAHVQLKSALQLAVQTVLAQFVRYQVPGRLLAGYSLVVSPRDTRMPDMAVAAETLATLMEAEQDNLSSPLLRDRIVSLYHWFAAQYLVSGQSGGPTSPAAVIWLHQASSRFLRYQDSARHTPWATNLSQATTQLLATYDQQGVTP